ncbi:unnamed protein product [Phytophthora lilii]|uniref:Unnamed protein product n=1 Tax=Phytophthora lilii TaxID=2077276 RepID=A0A9W6XJG9_9STRA|nr:unnamed protein product [Phytophthora lilii]
MRAVITFVVAALLLVTSISTESASAATKVASTTYTEALTNGKNFLSEHTSEQGEDRLGISVSAAEKIKALALPSDIPKALQRWLKNEKTAMIAFVRLQLTKAGTKLFDNPQFVPWLKYADDLSAQTGKPSAAISTLTAQYGDDALARLINQAVKDSRTKDTALRLQAEQLHHWLANKRSPDEVFKLLELDQAGNGILRNPLFRTWLNYLNKFNHENPSMKASLITPLYKHYSNMRVSIMVKEASKGDQEAVIVARIVENEHWLSNRKTPEAAFVSLRLIKPRDNFLTSNRLAGGSSTSTTTTSDIPTKR